MDLLTFINYGYNNGYGNGYGNGNGYDDGNGDGSGDGSGSGNGYGDGGGDGYGYSDGYSNGYSNGYGDGCGNSYGYGNDNDSGNGYGDGHGCGIEELDGSRMYIIDGIPTFVSAYFGPYAKGFILYYNSVKDPCYIALVDGYIAHGATLREAVQYATDKALQNKPTEERIAEVVKRYPDPDTAIPNRALFQMHHVLTGSCEYGRRQFCEAHGIDMKGSTTMREFCELTRDSYGRDIIRQLEEAYGIRETI